MPAAAPALGRLLCATDPSGLGKRAVTWEVRVARAPRVADAICLATHSRGGLAQLRPVLLIPAPLAD